MFFLILLSEWCYFQIPAGLIRKEWLWQFFEVVGGTNDGKFTGDFVFAAHAKATEAAVFDLSKHRLDDDFALFVIRLGRRCLHFAIHVLAQGLFSVGTECTDLASGGLAAARFEWAFGAHVSPTLVDPTTVFGFANHG